MTTDDTPPPPNLSGHHRKTWEAIFRHPVAHNLEWHDVASLLGAIAEVSEDHKSHVKVTRNGRTAVLQKPKHKDVSSVDDVLAIRRFLNESSTAASAEQGTHLVVVVDHHEARIYRTLMRGSVPERIEPYDPRGFLHHLRKEVPETSGQREPESHAYYEDIAERLRGADSILIFGRGTGQSSAMEKLVADLRKHHPDVARKVARSDVFDDDKLTADGLLARAREFFASKAG